MVGYIAVGHGIQPNGVYDPGAISKDRRWTEQSAADIVAKSMASNLRAMGVKVVDEAFQNDPNFYGTVAQANKMSADWLVAVHFDWNGAPNGSFGFWNPGSAKGKAIADALLKAVKDAKYETRDSWHKERSLYVLRNSNMPACLFECGRIGQSDLDTIDELQKFGAVLAGGMAQYLGVEIERPKPEPVVPKPVPDKPVAPRFPLPAGHYFGVPSRSPYCHSGFYWRADRPHIERWQQQMRKRGWRISVDGYFGEQSERVLKAFQKDKGLKQDGKLGPRSWKASWEEPVT